MPHFELSGCLACKLEDDLREAHDELDSLTVDHDEPWELLFDPKAGELSRGAQDIEQYRLSADVLEDLGLKVAGLRVQVKARVGALTAVGDASVVRQVPEELDQAQHDAIEAIRRRKLLGKEQERLEREEALASHKYRKRRHNELGADEVIGIAHAFLVDERRRKDIAEQYRVSIGLVSRVTSQCRTDEQFVANLRAKERLKAEQVVAVEKAVKRLLTEHGRVLSIEEVLEAAKQHADAHHTDGNRELTRARVGRIMVGDLGLRYKRTKVVNVRANLLNSRVQRQRFAS